MATVTMAEIQQLIEAAVKGAIAGGRKERGASLDERHFRRVDKLDGRNWKEFAFQYKTAVGSANPKIRNFLEEIQKGGKDPGIDDILLNETLEETARMGAEVYSTLSLLATGEALVVLRGGAQWRRFRSLEQALQQFRSEGTGQSTHGNDGRDEPQEDQGRAGADQGGGGLGGEGERPQDGARPGTG